MHFEEERSVRIYPNVTPTTVLWGFWGRVLMDELCKAADPVGVVELPAELLDDVPSAVAAVIGCREVEWIREHLPSLCERGSVVVHQRFLVLPKFCHAQYSTPSPSNQARMKRAKHKALERAREAGLLELLPDDLEQLVWRRAKADVGDPEPDTEVEELPRKRRQRRKTG